MKQIITCLYLLISIPSFAQKHDSENPHPFIVMRQHLSNDVRKCTYLDTIPKQLITKQPTLHKAFLSLSTCWIPGNKLYTSVEAGSWGTNSCTSFSAVADIVTVNHVVQYVVGPKAYYTSHQSPTLSYMFYVAPKFNIVTKTSILEFGVNQNYIISKYVIIGVALGNQLFDDSSRKTFFQVGAVYLFANK